MADVYGSDGYDIDEYGNMVPRGTTLNSNPTMTAEPPGSPGGPQLSTPQGGQVAVRPITTPNSSTGEPAVRSPSASTYQSPAVQTRPGLLTPNSRNGAPGYQVPTVNPMTLPVGGGLATGVGALNAFPTPTPEQMTKTLNNPPMADDKWGVNAISKLFGWGQPAAAAAPQTQTQPMPSRVATATPPPPPPPINLPPFNVPPPGNLPPFVRGPIPAAMSQHAPVQRAGQPNLGYGVPGAQPAAAPQAPSPMFTTIDRPNADVAGGRSVAGQLAPQYFNQAREPGGPAQMGALDLSSLFNHPAVAAQAAAHPMVQAAARVQGPLSALAPQRAPVIQRQPANNGLVGYGDRVTPAIRRRVGVQDRNGELTWLFPSPTFNLTFRLWRTSPRLTTPTPRPN